MDCFFSLFLSLAIPLFLDYSFLQDWFCIGFICVTYLRFAFVLQLCTSGSDFCHSFIASFGILYFIDWSCLFTLPGYLKSLYLFIYFPILTRYWVLFIRRLSDLFCTWFSSGVPPILTFFPTHYWILVLLLFFIWVPQNLALLPGSLLGF